MKKMWYSLTMDYYITLKGRKYEVCYNKDEISQQYDVLNRLANIV